MKKVVVLFFWLMVICLAAAIWGIDKIHTYVNSPINIEKETIITVENGMTYRSFTRKLVKEGLIESSIWSPLAGRIYPQFSKLKAGSYTAMPGTTFIELFQLSHSGKVHQFAITFVEGTTFKQWREQLKNTKNLKLELIDASQEEIADKLNLPYKNLEGLFLPETYYYSSGESDLTLLKRASVALNATLDEAWETRDSNLPIKSKYELLTLASIIEKETAVAKERPIISSVFINRLNKKMRLQTDPTVIYGMGEAYDGNITRKDLQTLTPYNTYVIYGLPPTPIAMVGKAAIFAAAKPERTPYYYFVAKGDGGHKFSTTLREHNKAVRDYLDYLKKNK